MSDQFRDYDFEEWLDEQEQDANDRLQMARRAEEEQQVNAFNAGFRRRICVTSKRLELIELANHIAVNGVGK
jgi:hypothetical protein